MVTLTVEILVHRVLRHMKAFQVFDGATQLEYKDLELLAREIPLGVYRNAVGSIYESVIVTDYSLIVVRQPEEPERINYSDISELTWYPESKRIANSVRIHLIDGSTTYVPVYGKQGGGADVFEFVRFLSRAVGIS